jgi:hypothetical protein
MGDGLDQYVFFDLANRSYQVILWNPFFHIHHAEQNLLCLVIAAHTANTNSTRPRLLRARVFQHRVQSAPWAKRDYSHSAPTAVLEVKRNSEFDHGVIPSSHVAQRLPGDQVAHLNPKTQRSRESKIESGAKLSRAARVRSLGKA